MKEQHETDESNDGGTAKIGLQEDHQDCGSRNRERFLHHFIKIIINVVLVAGNEPGQVQNQIQLHELRGLEPKRSNIDPTACPLRCGARPKQQISQNAEKNNQSVMQQLVVFEQTLREK
ncbi:hypothetical protein SDC9_149082 [bioreactor metagenome]|uniref:Uncharacterized protein n=1 Tax=bioreactor metagenome TaxID=1076179 RepID=A0A645EKM6_9ZZZZ